MSKKKSNNSLVFTAIIIVVALVFFTTIGKKEENHRISNEDMAVKNSGVKAAVTPHSEEGHLDSNILTRELEKNKYPATVAEIPAEPASNSETVSKRVPVDINKIPEDLPEDLKKQLLSPPEIPEELQAQINAPRGEVPEDIKKALEQPAHKVSAEDVNTMPEELLN